MTQNLVSTTYRNTDFPVFSQALQKNVVLGATMPFSTRAFVELTAWRELKCVDGSLNIGHRVLTSAASAMLAVVSLAEAAVRSVFCFLLLPMGFIGDKGNERYIAFLNGTALNLITPLLATIGTVGFLSSIPSMKTGEVGSKSLKPATRDQVESSRDIFRGQFYELTIDHKKGSITRKDIQV